MGRVVFRNRCGGQMDKTKREGEDGEDVGLAGVESKSGEKMQMTVIEQQ